MSKPTSIAVALLVACSAGHASNCDTIRAQIDAKVRASGVSAFTLDVVDAAASAPGRNVGSCDRGSRKIMYTAAPGAAGSAAATRPKTGAILTECKDGSVQMGGSCNRKPAQP